VHEFISGGCENHPTCIKRILAWKIVLDILYIKFYGESTYSTRTDRRTKSF
jgi:hypothetical protein